MAPWERYILIEKANKYIAARNAEIEKMNARIRSSMRRR